MTIKNTLDEIKSLLTDLKTHAESSTALTGTDKTNLEKRINHLLKKTNPELDASHKLDNDLEDIENIETAVGKDKIETAKKQRELEDKNKKLETDNQAKDKLIKEKEEEIGKKITKELVEKLEKLEPGKVDETKLTELKTLLTELKEKGVQVDLSSTNSKVEEVKKKVETKETNFWGMATCGLTGLILVGVVYLIFVLT